MKALKNYSKTLNELRKNLSPKNSQIFGDIIIYIRTSSLKEIDIEEALQEILDIFLQCQADGKDIDEIIGKDYKAFADSIIEAHGKSNKILDLLQYTALIIMILIGIDFAITTVTNFITKKPFTLNYTLSLWSILQFIFAASIVYVIFTFIHKTSFNKDKKSEKRHNIIFMVVFFIVYFLFILSSKYLSKFVIATVPVYIILILASIVYFSIDSYQYSKYKKSRQLTNDDMLVNTNTKTETGLKGFIDSHFALIDIFLNFALAIIFIYSGYIIVNNKNNFSLNCNIKCNTPVKKSCRIGLTIVKISLKPILIITGDGVHGFVK
ncbi:DUF1048 domain-containing protein, partial [Clostridium acetireducens]|uniref:DUF1048 domain-containing protein n=1 Tax=Clostridium acetireducens TaxID=76489 RepID=UPI0008725EFA